VIVEGSRVRHAQFTDGTEERSQHKLAAYPPEIKDFETVSAAGSAAGERPEARPGRKGAAANPRRSRWTATSPTSRI
jgi:hypothetical protein